MTKTTVVTEQGSFANRGQAADASGLRSPTPTAGVTKTPQGYITHPDQQAPNALPLDGAPDLRVYTRASPSAGDRGVQVVDLSALGMGEVEVGQAVAAGLLVRNPYGELAVGPEATKRAQDLTSAAQAKATSDQAAAASAAAYQAATSAIEGGLSAAGLDVGEEINSYFQTGQVSTNAMTALAQHMGGQGNVAAVIEAIEHRVASYVFSEASAIAQSMGSGGLDRETAAGLFSLMEQQPDWPAACTDLLRAQPHKMGQLIRQCLDGGQRLRAGDPEAVTVQPAGSNRNEVGISR